MESRRDTFHKGSWCRGRARGATIGFQEPRGVRRIVELDAHRRAPLEPLEQCRDKSYSCCTVTARAPSAPASRASPRSPSARASPTRLRSMYPSHRSNQSRRSPNRRYFSGQRARIVASHQYRARFTSRWHLRSQDGCGEPHLRARRAASAGGIGGQATIRSPRRQSGRRSLRKCGDFFCSNFVNLQPLS